jgi:20S proteasome alpha/beta subunit
MSIIIVTRYKDGIILAADSFIFDNDGEVPYKSMDFRKVLISKSHKSAMVAVGSSWVFHEAYAWLKKQRKKKGIIGPLSAEWKKLNVNWKRRRARELKKEKHTTLRPVSNSLIVIAQQANLDVIQIIDPKGKIHETKSFVMSGSGAELARHYLSAKEKSFKQSDTLNNSLNLLRECYRAASHDLYVTGIPAIVIVKKAGILDLTKQCEEVWQECESRFFVRIKNIIKRQ